MTRDVRVGISGWRYEPWRGVFYPENLVQKRELEFASQRVNSIEINGTFYSLQTPASFRTWANETPDDFVFAVKGPKYISHRKRLRDIRVPLANFFASGVLLLCKKLGPILWQFPPWEKFELDRFREFLEILPKSTVEAAELAAENTIENEQRKWVQPTTDQKLRYAFEPRNESFNTPDFVKLLRRHNAALVFADNAGKWPSPEDVTANFIYIRLHGAEELYASGYTNKQLKYWAKRINIWKTGSQLEDANLVAKKRADRKTGRDVYVYFDNSIKIYAPRDAMRLKAMLEKPNRSGHSY
jgi:uncharacterized protein YecE (DUF72 family)